MNLPPSQGVRAALPSVKPPFPFSDRLILTLGRSCLALFLLYGLLLVAVPLLPFWLDEWLLMDNLKFKSQAALWGHLEHTQQFPRVYLQLIKSLAAALEYSYFSLRLPSFLAHCFGIALLLRLAKRLFPGQTALAWLWILIYVSFNTSIHYFVQLKQYTMEMALSLLAIWQLLELLRPEPPSRSRLALLGLSCLLAPAFSYTYPIVFTPVVLVAVLSRQLPPRRIIPLAAAVAGIAVIYVIDTRHVLADPGMQDFWQDLLLKDFDIQRFFRNLWLMFCTLGAGDLFGSIFGGLGLIAFLRATGLVLWGRIRAGNAPAMLYSCLLVWLAIGLFIAGKLPLGTFRLNAFLVPALALMIADLLRKAAEVPRVALAARLLTGLLFLAALGTIVATMAELAGTDHRRKLDIYRSSAAAIAAARKERLPVLVSPGIAFPFEDRWPGDWILKVQPAWRPGDSMPVCNAPMHADAAALERYAPSWHGPALYLDGPLLTRVVLP